MKVVSYLRVSTSRYGDSGLGLDAQREYIARAAEQNGWEIVTEFVDKASGRVAIEKRPEGSKALDMCKQLGAHLVVAKLDRLSRSAHHITRLVEEIGIEFKVATMSHATTAELNLYAGLAEKERKFIRQLKKDAMPPLVRSVNIRDAAASFDPLMFGPTAENRKLAAVAVSNRVLTFHLEVRPHIQDCLNAGLTTLVQIADRLNSKGIKTSRGGIWSATQVKRVMDSLELKF
ncbi:recombinase family protein [Pseudomonas umsongensis]|uniref:recombinase family protein n=1 Tax=Pseudomonas umsongensis TaxID=198618 RepID=UPI00200B2F1B|nr:recombinase family protein [Pseudomonas umsongensis]MCK8682562.1 recombinase family protein [Pseudomonas umsongensis]